MGNGFIALAAAIGMGIWVYRKTARRGGGDFKKEIAPAMVVAILTFLIAMTILWMVF
jgi:hypothetical protein